MIELWFDFTCPYCYSGYKKILMAEKKLGKKFDIKFHSFILDKDRKEKISFKDYVLNSYDNKKIEMVFERIHKTFDYVGINIDIDRMYMTSTNIHHQILKNIEAVKHREYVEKIMETQYLKYLDINDEIFIKNIVSQFDCDIENIDINKTKDLIKKDMDESEKQGLEVIPYIKTEKGKVQGDFILEELLEIL